MNTEKNDIEKLIQKQYGSMPDIDTDMIDQVIRKATTTQRNNNVLVFRELAVAACLIFSIFSGAFIGYAEQHQATLETKEQAVFLEVENALFTHNSINEWR